MQKFATEVIATSIMNGDVVANETVLNALKALKTNQLPAIGVARKGNEYEVVDQPKFDAWIASMQPSQEETETEDAAEGRTAQVWLNGNQNVSQVDYDGEYPEVVIRSFGAIKANANVRFVCEGEKNGARRRFSVSLHVNYLKAMMNDKNASLVAVQNFCMQLKKGLGFMLNSHEQVAGKTGYFRAIEDLNDAEREALGKAQPNTVRKDSKGRVGFVHTTSGIRYNVASTLTEEEANDVRKKLDTLDKLALDALRERELQKARTQGSLDLKFKLQELNDLKEEGFLTQEEFDARRALLLAGKA